MTVEERLKARLVQDPSGCWIWMGCVRKGYGQISVKGKMKNVHRVTWELTHGPIPKGVFVLHHCDVRPCANPDHLFLGTNTDNMRDMNAKGRGFNLSKQVCKRGHPFDEENTYYDRSQKGNRRRACKACSALKARAYRERKKVNG